ncbi:MAG TPA: ABC transporter permease subunit [Gemmatimonadales bacterium]|nr:ABC transporter permease subunit [Gemmatimonadales bacterium]
MNGLSGSGKSAWRVILARELRDLWIGGKALHLMLIYSLLLGIYSFLLASNAEVQLLPRKEMVLEMVKASIAVCLLISLLIGADSVSGERERGTLEVLLLTPATRRQLMLGKLTAAMSPWPVALAISIPYWAVLAKGDPVFGQALIWATLCGTLMVPATAALGMLASMWCNTNKSAMMLSLGIFLLMLIPVEVTRPGRTATVGEMKKAAVLLWVNPWDAVASFLGNVLALGSHPSQVLYQLTLPVAFPIIVLMFLFWYGRRGLKIHAETATWLQSIWRRWTSWIPVAALRPRPSAHP